MSISSIALGNLRAAVILIVLAFHSVLAYLGSLPGDRARVQCAALSMAGISDHRQRAVVRLRPVLRAPRRLSDVVHVLSVRPFRLARPRAQRQLRIPAATPASAGPAVRIGGLPDDAGRSLSGLSRHRADPGLARVLGGVARAAVLAERAAVVLVAIAGVERRRRRCLRVRAPVGRGSRPLRRRGRRAPRAVLCRPRDRVRRRLRASGHRVYALGLGRARTVRAPAVPAAALRRLFLRGSRRRRLWHRQGPAGGRRDAGAALGPLARRPRPPPSCCGSVRPRSPSAAMPSRCGCRSSPISASCCAAPAAAFASPRYSCVSPGAARACSTACRAVPTTCT